MMTTMSHIGRHDAEHAAAVCHSPLQPAASDLIRVGSRRWFLQTGLAGLAGLSLPDLLRCRAQAAAASRADRKAVILIWLSGGPSQLDTWDPKPDAPGEVRGPFGSIATKVPGVRISEYFPLQAAIADRLALVRSVDCQASIDHFPAPMQAGNPLAQRSKTDPHFGTHPSMGSVAARFRGPNDPEMPAFVGMADLNLFFADVLGAGPLGGRIRGGRRCRTGRPTYAAAWRQGGPGPGAGGRFAGSSTDCAATSTPATRWPGWSITAGRPWRSPSPARRGRRSAWTWSPTGSAKPTAATVSAKRCSWRGGSSRPGSRL